MKRKRTIRPEEHALWKKVARTVTPLDEAKKRSLEEDADVPPAVRSGDTDVAQGDVSPRAPGSHLPRRHEYRAPATHHPPVPHDRSTEKRVRRGRVDIDARIDLHGLTQDRAYASLRHFVMMAHASGYRTVLVITGKGLKARQREAAPWDYVEEPGVLRRKLPEWLGLPELRQYVSGLAPAHIRHGGGGAFYVTLRVGRKT
ncbi:MAG: Smr/MutS family protein [Pseudomonadota bacterium]|nr:Smr/MutS family protein [Pseudomonadota bacterium]